MAESMGQWTPGEMNLALEKAMRKGPRVPVCPACGKAVWIALHAPADSQRMACVDHECVNAHGITDWYPEGYWEKGIGSNYHGYGDDPGWHQTARLLHDHVGDGIRVLELGCAMGYFVAAARVHFDWVEGIDVSAYAVGKPAPGAEGQIRVGSATDLSRFRGRPDSPELICSWEMLEHLTYDEILTCLTEIMHTLPENGEMWHRIALDTAGDREFAGIPDHHPHDDHTHVTIKSKQWWRDLIEGSFWEIDGDAYTFYRLTAEENTLSREFRGRDWENRFFVYRKVKLERPERFTHPLG